MAAATAATAATYVFTVKKDAMDDVCAIRNEVLVKGRQIPADIVFDGAEEQSLHVLVYGSCETSDATPVVMGYARLRLLAADGSFIPFLTLLQGGRQDEITGKGGSTSGPPLTLKVERVCVREAFRQCRVGANLMLRIEEFARHFPSSLAEVERDADCEATTTPAWLPESSIMRLKLSAQVQASGFYQKIGYQETSDVYMDFIPHVWMEKQL